MGAEAPIFGLTLEVKMKTTKICTKCKQSKNLSSFSKNKNKKDNKNNICRECYSGYGKTKKGIVSKIYGNQRSNSRQRNHISPEYTKLELQEWLYNQELFHKLYSEWVQSGYSPRLKPSVDRKNDNIHYCINNIQLMTWEENKAKASTDMRAGKLTHGSNPQKTVTQYTKNDEFVAEYPSTREAGRQTQTNYSSIASCCRGKLHSTGGFVWKYKTMV